MFDFLFYRKRAEVTRILAGRVNGQFAASLHPGERRISRSSYCEVVWYVPSDARGRPEFDSAVAVLIKDISSQGLSLIHTEPLHEEHLLIGLRREDGMVFLRCRREHCTPLGCGYFQLGLAAEEVVDVPTEISARLRLRYDAHGKSPDRRPVTVG